MPFPRCVDLFYDMWKLIFVARNGGGIHREIIQHRRYSQTHHWCFTAGWTTTQRNVGFSRNLSLQTSWEKSEYCTCYHVTESPFCLVSFLVAFRWFSMYSNLWAKGYEMAWSTLVFSSVFWDTWRPIRLGASSHDDVWTGGHTQASGQAYTQSCVGFQMFSGFCNYKTEMSICNVIPATQNVL